MSFATVLKKKQTLTQSLDLSFNAGQTVMLSGNLAYFLIGNSNNGVTVDTQINALNSVRYYVDPVTAGATYTMASGVDYRTPLAGKAVQLPNGVIQLLLEEERP